MKINQEGSKDEADRIFSEIMEFVSGIEGMVLSDGQTVGDCVEEVLTGIHVRRGGCPENFRFVKIVGRDSDCAVRVFARSELDPELFVCDSDIQISYTRKGGRYGDDLEFTDSLEVIKTRIVDWAKEHGAEVVAA